MSEIQSNDPRPCDCTIEFGSLPDCHDIDINQVILCAVAHEQAEMAKMLKILGCKLCKTNGWLPDTLPGVSDVERINLAEKIETDITGIIEALANKENAIANKVRAILCHVC